MTPQQVAALKVVLAVAAAALLAWGAWLSHRGRPRVHARLRDGLLLALGILGALAWWNFLEFRFAGYVHPKDTFHYYVGAKYFPELGYTRLYACAAVADAEDGMRGAAEARVIRDLETYELVRPQRFLDRPEACKRHFSPERWSLFVRDIAFFRERMPLDAWQATHADHGYNPPPTWTLLGRSLLGDAQASEAQIFALSLIDPALLLLMWGCVLSTFGWRATCVALVFWGTNQPAGFLWTGGGFLRQGWLFASVIGICLLRRGLPFSAGLLLGGAALLRIFPAMLFLGPALVAFHRARRERTPRPTASHVRLLAGAVVAGAVLVPASASVGDGLRVWRDFATNLRLHADTPFANDVGLPAALSPAPGLSRSVPGAEGAASEAAWRASRREGLGARLPILVGLVVLYGALLVRATARQEDWAAAALSVGAVAVATNASSYYASMYLAFGLLWVQRPAIGALLCAYAAASWLPAWRGGGPDEVFTGVSILTVVLVFATTALATAPQPSSPSSAARTRPRD